MPKLPKAFGRRKSTTNALEEASVEAPVNQHTFKVFERHDPGSKSFDLNGKLRVNGRPSIDPEKDDNLFSGFSNRYVIFHLSLSFLFCTCGGTP